MVPKPSRGQSAIYALLKAICFSNSIIVPVCNATLLNIALYTAFNKSSTAYFMGLFKEATNISFVIGIIPINYTSYFSRAPCHASFSIATLCHGYDKIFLKVIE